MKAIILVIIFITFIWEFFLTIVKVRSDNPIPENVKDIYDTTEYEKSKKYNHEKNRLEAVTLIFSLLLSIFMFGTNCFSRITGLLPKNEIVQMLGVIVCVSVIGLLATPFSYYSVFSIEERYGFNRSTKKTFFIDLIRDFILDLILTSVMGFILMGLHHLLGELVGILFAVVMSIVMLGLNFISPLIIRLTYKLTPLEDGELKEKLTTMLTSHGFSVKEISVADASRRTTKANAFFTGFGSSKTIILFDNLLEQMNTEEICAVFAHEMGHGIHKDTLKMQLMSVLEMVILGMMLWFDLRTERLFTAYGFSGINYGFAMALVFMVEFPILSPVIGLLTNGYSRRAEYLADKQAVDEGYGPALVTALKTLHGKSYAELVPSDITVKLEYSHPTLSQRIAAIDDPLTKAGKS